jgi:hypothetical protein
VSPSPSAKRVVVVGGGWGGFGAALAAAKAGAQVSDPTAVVARWTECRWAAVAVHDCLDCCHQYTFGVQGLSLQQHSDSAV